MNIQKLMQQAQAMQKKMESIQKDLAAKEYEGQAGSGLVKITLYGNGQAKSVSVDPSLLAEDQKETLEDLIAAAINSARRDVDEDSAGAMGGIGLPAGLKLPF